MMLQKICLNAVHFRFIPRNVSWAPNQHIIVNSDGSYEIEDWSNGCCEFSLPSQEWIKYIEKGKLF